MTTAELAAAELSVTVMSSGQSMTGGTASFAASTVTMKLQWSPLGAVAVTTDEPMAKKEPEAGSSVTGPEPQLPTASGAS